MLRKLLSAKNIATVLIVLQIFGAAAPIAYAQLTGLTSLVTAGIGAATTTAISCNKAAISQGLSSLFGGGKYSGSYTNKGSNTPGQDAVNRAAKADANDAKATANAAEASQKDADAQDALAKDPENTELQQQAADADTADAEASTNAYQASQEDSAAQDALAKDNSGANARTGSGAVPVTDANNTKNTAATAANTGAVAQKETCTDKIERAAAQTILKQLTISTVNWINHGFQGGGPLYIGDTSTFLKNIGDQTVRQLGASIGFNIKDFPFGRAVMQQLINSTRATFESAARYSLNQVIAERSPGSTVADFNLNFAVGGWSAFLGQTDWNNNPIGFGMQAEQELANRTAATRYSPAQDIKDQLQRNGGFLDLKTCVNPKDYDPDATENNPALASAQAAVQAAADRANQADQALASAQAAYNNDALHSNPGLEAALQSAQIYDQQANAKLTQAEQSYASVNTQANANGVCKQWQTQTPGSVIESSLNKALGSPLDQLALGKDLSTDLTAVFDALINHYVSNGLNDLSKGMNGSATSAGTYGSSGNTSNGYQNNSSYVRNNVSVDGGGALGTNFLNAGNAFQVNLFDLSPSGFEAESSSVDDSGSPVHRLNLVGIINREQQLVQTGTSTAKTMHDYFGWSDADQQTWTSTMQARDRGTTDLLDKEIGVTSRLIQGVYQLDFCVPGPHPGWQQDADASFQSFLGDSTRFPADSSMSGLGKAANKYGSVVFTAVGAIVGSVVPGIGTVLGALVGGMVGTIVQLIGGNNLSNDAKNEKAYGYYISTMLNISLIPEFHGQEVNWNGPVNTAKTLTRLEQKYLSAMNGAYSTSVLEAPPYDFSPQLISDDENEWANLSSYQQGITQNRIAVQATQSTIGQLIFLGKRIHNLEEHPERFADAPPGAPGTATCSASLAGSVVNGDSSAVALRGSGTAICPNSYDYWQTQIEAINAVTNTSKLTDYQRELKHINDLFNLIAPNLVADSDIAAEEATLSNLANKVDQITNPASGDIEECIKEVNYIQSGCSASDPCPNAANADGAPMEPVGRIPFPDSLSPYFTQEFIDQFHTSISFLPDYYYGNGAGGAIGLGGVANPALKVRPPSGGTFGDDPNVTPALLTKIKSANAANYAYIPDPSEITIPDPNLVWPTCGNGACSTGGNVVSTPASPKGNLTKNIDETGFLPINSQMYPFSLAGLEAMIGIY